MPAPICPQPQRQRPSVPEQPPTTEPSPFAEIGLAPERALALGGETFAAPNMVGHLLNASRSVFFAYSRAAGNINVPGPGATSITNPNVAENNSPLPEDRVYYRYNFFDRALFVTGLSTAPPIPLGNGVFQSQLATRGFDVNMHTFGVEKTFFDRLLSVELRVPFQTTLASKLDLSAGNVVGTLPGQDLYGNQNLQVVPTPENTLGRETTEWGDMTLIFKSLLYQSPRLAFSGGLSINIPTAPDTRVHVRDFLSNAFGPTELTTASIVRDREFDITNDNWNLSPFFAVLTTPTYRWFAQGFMQFDFPLTNNKIIYTDRMSQPGLPITSLPAMVQPLALQAPFTASRGIGEQILMHVDAGVGYWLVRNPSAQWVTGIAPSLELHYTTTLENAQIVTLPNDPSTTRAPGGDFTLEAAPQVGNRRNRIDILDLTVGNTFEIANRVTVATGLIFPLKRNSDRTFDWEFQLQLNYYFGCPRNRPAATF
jgi:hypothetical protein